MIGRYLLILITCTLNKFVSTEASSSVNCPQVENKEDVMFTINAKCYHYVEEVEEQVTYAFADENCRSRSGHLVTIKDNATQSALVDHLQFLSDSHTILLGLEKKGHGWNWITGEALTYENWNGDLGCSGGCDCAKMSLASGGRWEKFGCDTTDWYTVFVCEYGPTSKGCVLVTRHSLSVTLCAALALIQQLSSGYL